MSSSFMRNLCNICFVFLTQAAIRGNGVGMRLFISLNLIPLKVIFSQNLLRWHCVIYSGLRIGDSPDPSGDVLV
jgi:hypothetical protein